MNLKNDIVLVLPQQTVTQPLGVRRIHGIRCYRFERHPSEKARYRLCYVVPSQYTPQALAAIAFPQLYTSTGNKKTRRESSSCRSQLPPLTALLEPLERVVI
jgi:hypothetical protein